MNTTVRFVTMLLGMLALLAQAQTAVAQVPLSLNAEQARHFLLRTGFAPSQAEVDAIAGRSTREVIAQTLAQASSASPRRTPPGFVSQPPPIPMRYLKTKEELQALRQQQMREGLEIKVWWMQEMLQTPTPLKERMALFWHGHFATSQQKVVSSQAMWNQHQLLRSNALGNFRFLLHGIAKDPAMLVYLDGANSRKEAPNENFAREVMELFTLGEGSKGTGYSEQDIREAARAFTGWSIEREDFSFRFRPAFHDAGSKTVMGRTGNFNGDDVLDILLDQPSAARFIVGKLWREFVSPTPDPNEVERIAQVFRRSRYDIQSALSELLLTNAFWQSDNRGSLVKSPVELVVGTLRQFDFKVSDALPFVIKSAQLGQNLLVPPNVKGWPGYTDWINATTLLERKRFTEQLFRSVEARADASMNSTNPMNPMAVNMQEARLNGMAGTQGLVALLGRSGLMQVAEGLAQVRFDPDGWLRPFGAQSDREPMPEQKARIEQSVLAVAITQPVPSGSVGVAYLRNLTLDPAYQLK